MVNKIPAEYECPLDICLLGFIDTHLAVYKRLNFTPNVITTFSLVIGVLSAYCIHRRNYYAASGLFLLAYYFDCADGKFARKYNMQTQFGDYYDHFSDLFKMGLVLYVLYRVNRARYLSIQWIIYGLILLNTLHLGYQEVLYDTEESPTLALARRVAEYDPYPHRTIQITRHFGCGTLMIVMAAVIAFWGCR